MSSTQPAPAPPPAAVLARIITGRWVSHMVAEAARLGIADLLDGGPQSAEDLARSTGTHAPSLYRLMRALAGVGIFAELPGQRFALTPVGDELRTNAPESLRYLAMMMGDRWEVEGWANIRHSVRTGESSAPSAIGKNLFDYFADNPEQGEVFNNAMTNFSRSTTPAVVRAYDFSGIRNLADIGGGYGFLLGEVLRANPAVHGVLFDLPEVVAGAPTHGNLAGLDGRVTLVGGSFLESVPAGCDAYMMKHIVHDWNDDACVQLLENCRRQLPHGGRVLIVEHVLDGRPESTFANILDIEMLVQTPGGKERTATEFAELFTRAGLRFSRVVPTESPVCVIEGIKD